MSEGKTTTTRDLPSWRVSPEDSRDVEVWTGATWVFDCCLRTATEAAKWVADNIRELEEIHRDL